jgi:hypothetical protein
MVHATLTALPSEDDDEAGMVLLDDQTERGVLQFLAAGIDRQAFMAPLMKGAGDGTPMADSALAQMTRWTATWSAPRRRKRPASTTRRLCRLLTSGLRLRESMGLTLCSSASPFISLEK